MNLSFMTVLITVFTLIILAIPGYILGKKKMLPDGSTKAFTTFLLFVCQPALTFMSFQKTAYQEGLTVNILIVAGLALLTHAIVIGIVLLSVRNKSKDTNINVMKFAMVFGNVGYMGLPFLQALFGSGHDEIIIYGAVIIAVFNFLNWTVGIFIISGDKKYMSLKKAIINPPFLALVVSLPLFLILKQPIGELGSGVLNEFLSKLMKSVDFLGEMVTPVSMTILGLRLAEMKLKDVFLNKYAYITSSVKLIAVPLVAILILLPFVPVDLGIKYAIFFTLAMPSATSSLLFSERFGGEPHTASAIVLFSTILSVITIPLMFLLFKSIFG